MTAYLMASLQEELQGGTICGIGKGDSSDAHIGKRQATTEELRTCVVKLKSYLKGDANDAGNMQSPIRWIDPEVIPPVPIDVAYGTQGNCDDL